MASKINISYVTEYELCDKNHFNVVKGISVLAALAAFIAHRYYRVANMSYIFNAAIVVFALCSGYGISESYNRKRGLVHYWENKMIKVWLPSLAVLVVTSLAERGNALSWINNSPLGLSGKVLYLIFGGYAAFWLMFQISDKRSVRLIGMFAIAITAFFFVSQNWSIRYALLALPVGVMIPQLGLKYKVRKWKWAGKLLSVLVCAIVAIGTGIAAFIIQVDYVSAVLWNVAYLAVALLLLLLTWIAEKIQILGIFAPVGMASYGFYLLYESTLRLLNNNLTGKKMFIVLALLCVAAGVFTVLRELMVTWNRNLRRRGKTHLKGSM